MKPPQIDPDLRLSDFDYHLPEQLIAQEPPAKRDGGRLLLVDRATGRLQDMTIWQLPELLSSSDVVVVNNTRVLHARLRGKRSSGGAAEVLLLDRLGQGEWNALIRPARKLRAGAIVDVPGHDPGLPPLRVLLTENLGDGRARVVVPVEVEGQLERYGEMPLPPYVHERLADAERYQTVYGRAPGSAAAPTAGLHLSDQLIGRFREQGTQIAEVTLHVGLDTFRPVTAERVADHVIHREWCSVSAQTASAIATAQRARGRVVAIGTTTARTLESWGRLPTTDQPEDWGDWTSIFITPGHVWTTVDALLTNFHLPRSTLLMMIHSFAGKELAAAAYAHAIRERYRFYSFGDAMLIV